MTDTITQQASEQVQRAMKAANSARLLLHFDYCEPSHRCARVQSPHRTEREREVSRLNWSSRPYQGNHDRRVVAATGPSGHPIQGQTMKSTAASTPYAIHSRGHGDHYPGLCEGYDSISLEGFARRHEDACCLAERKIASAIIRRILIDMGNSVDIIAWDCLKKLTYPKRDIIPLVHPILGFWGAGGESYWYDSPPAMLW
ncbi:hypothetical protein Cgig2_015470 [Carnegiea gigantea]|uniref:Uncharacterized protein n=1 Tax=Carnegiea gigantea TaxID=171969 RepID=A0A9Q1GIF9_9CARY|nr:hypothetical protein Cgig2_015470 [Carnegiea gigantea]